jgi:hypothetical protein
MKRTKIKYEDLGDKVKVVGIENCATIDQIKASFGYDVRNRYFDPEKVYYRLDDDNPRSVRINTADALFMLNIDSFLDKPIFSKFIGLMKQAGLRLSRIAKEEKAKRVHEVLI